jgi:primosomal protein N'
MRIKRGEARIIVGPRSAVFSPAQNPGLIIIDEEHDNSFKSGSTPRYHARQVALRGASPPDRAPQKKAPGNYRGLLLHGRDAP